MASEENVEQANELEDVQPLFDLESLYKTAAWDTDEHPGRAGSGLTVLVPAAAILAAVIIAAALWLLDGWPGRIIAGAVVVLWLLFTAGAIWQIREMRAAGGYTRLAPPDDRE